MRAARALLVIPALVVPLLAQGAPAPDEDIRQDEDIRHDVHQAVLQTVDWIARQAVEVEGKGPDGTALLGVVFPMTAENSRLQEDVIYGGSAGVLLFLENVAAVLDDARAAELADRTARGLLIRARRKSDGLTWAPRPGEGTAALYVGDAGIGHAFLVRARLREDPEALQWAVAVGDALLARGDRYEDQLGWDDQVEIIYGGAGTALFLLELAEAVGDDEGARFRDAALAVGKWLLAEAELVAEEPAQRRWRWQLAGNQPYVGFSHGTAGVAYALLRIGLATGDEECLQGAVDGAAWLEHIGVREDALLRWPVLAGRQTSMGGWCHGPPGTARLFLLLHAHTGEQRYLDTALASARWVMAQAGPEDAEIPPAFPPSLCCGVAGAIDFFCDLHRVTDDPAFGAFALRAGRYLLDLAVVDGDGVKWANGTNAHGRGVAQHGVDLMLGASGEGFALLRLLTLEQEQDPISHLPDRRVTTDR